MEKPALRICLGAFTHCWDHREWPVACETSVLGQNWGSVPIEKDLHAFTPLRVRMAAKCPRSGALTRES